MSIVNKQLTYSTIDSFRFLLCLVCAPLHSTHAHFETPHSRLIATGTLRIKATYPCRASAPLPPQHKMSSSSPSSSSTSAQKDADPILLSVFSNRFSSIADAMGRTLEQTSISVNVKLRLDFSCALFGPDGSLVSSRSDSGHGTLGGGAA